MPLANIIRLSAVVTLGATALTVGGAAAPVQGRVADPQPVCFTSTTTRELAGARGAAPDADHRPISPAEQRAISRRTHHRLAAQAAKRGGPLPLLAATVPVYVHVMRNNAGRGDVTDRQVYQQVAVLNQDFAPVGVSFNLVDTRRYNNSAWHNDQQSARYRALTRLGGANALNIWLVDSGHLGVATFPWDAPKAVDGIRIDYQSLPGGNIVHYNMGKTAVHEAGHWLGLFHTFQGGCTTLNDQVADTPAQATPTTGCPANRDSCRMPGTDPIHNYMDYSWDSCYTEFTQGQAERINRMWAAYRA